MVSLDDVNRDIQTTGTFQVNAYALRDDKNLFSGIPDIFFAATMMMIYIGLRLRTLTLSRNLHEKQERLYTFLDLKVLGKEYSVN